MWRGVTTRVMPIIVVRHDVDDEDDNDTRRGAIDLKLLPKTKHTHTHTQTNIYAERSCSWALVRSIHIHTCW